MNRRTFLRDMAAGGLGWAAGASRVWGQEGPKAPDPTLSLISGKPRERGRQYGQKFKEPIRSFLDGQIYHAFARQPSRQEEVLRYAGACAKAVKAFSPALLEEMEGIAEGAGLKAEEVVLLTLHEELYHQGVIPSVPKCTAVTAGLPETRDGNAYVGQNWDWMESVYGLSQILLWKRTEGPSVLAYAYPGLWIGAGLNSAGLALCWTSGQGMGITGPR